MSLFQGQLYILQLQLVQPMIYDYIHHYSVYTAKLTLALSCDDWLTCSVKSVVQTIIVSTPQEILKASHGDLSFSLLRMFSKPCQNLLRKLFYPEL